MFDDQSPQPVGNTVPPNLPMGEPEDIFARVQPADDAEGDFDAPLPPDPSGLSTPIPDGIGAKTALSAGILQPKQERSDQFSNARPVISPESAHPETPRPSSIPTPSTPVTHTLPKDAPDMYNTQQRPDPYAIREPHTSKGIVTFIIVVAVLLILGGGIFFIYDQFKSRSGAPVETTQEDVVEEDAGNLTETFEPIVVPDIPDTTNTQGVTGQELLFGDQSDLDADGLDDVRERSIGTDVAHWDTDGDELSDGDEVIIWKTDPLNPDTDGDGYEDGAEVKNGYSPTGPGKIFEPPSDPVGTGGAT